MLCCHSARPGQVGELSRKKSNEVQQGIVQSSIYLYLYHMHQCRLGSDVLGKKKKKKLSEKDEGVLEDKRLAMIQQCALVAKDNGILECVKKAMGNKSREVILHFCSVPVRSYLQYHIHF